jgi:DNA (cytosine-5)-methyltransferase 1
MENVPDAPLPVVPGYAIHAQLYNNRWCGGVQNRIRRISFGTRSPGLHLDIPGELFQPIDYAPAVCASGGIKPGMPSDHSARLKHLGWKTREAFEQIRRLQGLPDSFDLPAFTISAAIKAVGNGVPLPLGRAIAAAVSQTFQESENS